MKFEVLITITLWSCVPAISAYYANIPLSSSLYLEPPCSSQIYCTGSLLDVVQLASLYPDSKTFVDMRLKYSYEKTLSGFLAMMKANGPKPTKKTVQEFVDKYFDEPGSELDSCNLTDWKPQPRFLDLIRHPELRQWGSDLNLLWNKLCRKMSDDVLQHPEKYSIIPIPNPFIVPGGRFREYYYWDTYWVVRGLLYSEMYSTTRGILENFLSLIDRFGFVQLGGRVYYLRRSQLPLLAPMIKDYVEHTGDDQFAFNAVEKLEREFQFWMINRTRIVNGHRLAFYDEQSTGPRPESYREDMNTSKAFSTDEEKLEIFRHIKASAESGMDFTSRWFINENGTNTGKLKDLKTRFIIPVELNVVLYWNAQIIAEIYLKAGNLAKGFEYESRAQNLFNAIQSVLWQEDIGVWLDYDVLNDKPRNYFTPTNLSPLWVKCYNISDSKKLSKSVIKYLENNEIEKYPGGIPQTLQNTGEQWDFPNAWAPMQYMVILGLENLGTPETEHLAYKFASKWVQSNYEAYKETGAMFEKYDAEVFGGYGGGGEYVNQKGFGFSNGVIVEFLIKYGDSLKPSVDKRKPIKWDYKKPEQSYPTNTELLTEDNSEETEFHPYVEMYENRVNYNFLK